MGLQGEGGPRGGSHVAANEVGEVEVEEHVAVDEEHRVVAEQAPHLSRTAARAQQLALEGVRDAQPEGTAVPDRLAHGGGQVMEVDDDVGDAVAAQQLQRPVQQRAVEHRQDGLGAQQGERPHAQAQPGRQDHRLHSSIRGGAELTTAPPRGHSSSPPCRSAPE